MPNQPKTPLRAIRIDDDLWHRAQAAAKEDGTTVSDIVRESLTDDLDARDRIRARMNP